MSARWLRGAIAAVLLAAACTASREDAPPADTADAGTGAALPHARACPAGCEPRPPNGWDGPTVVFDDFVAGSSPLCPAGYPISDVLAHRGLDAGPASCACGPGVVTGASCVVTVTQSNAADCTGGTSEKLVVDGGASCADLGSAFFAVAKPELDAGTCTFDPTISAPPASYAQETVACGLIARTLCADRPDCLVADAPQAPFGLLCFHRDGDVECPPDPYDRRFVAYRGEDDTRACSPCSGDAGTSCGTSLRETDDCDDDSGAIVPADGTCRPVAAGDSLDLTPLHASEGACAQTSGGTPIGDVRPSDPVTFCCFVR